MAPVNHKLALFDIDGTLIHHVASHRFEDQYEMALKETYNIDHDFSVRRYNGNVDRYITWDILKRYGISKKEFLDKFPAYIDAMHRVLESRSSGNVLFTAIESSLALLKKLSKQKNVTLGIITGNAERIARWKLSHTGIDHYFSFGLYGDEADDRNELALLVFEKAKRELHRTFAPSDVIVVGDTVFDIRCGKAIGAVTVAVTTGLHGPKTDLSQEHPDVLVDSLLDDKVLSLFSLK